MVSRNNITGDRLINKRLSKEGEDNWDKIFDKKEDNADIIIPNLDKTQLTKEDIFNSLEKHLNEYELDKSTGEMIKKVNP